MSTAFGRARRRNVYRRLGRVVGGRGARPLLPLDEAERRLRPFNRSYLGMRAIPVGQIVGTDGRGSDFDREFHPRRPDVATRWRSVEQAFPDGGFPPIVAYLLGDAYFVVDGHHRVAVARRRGMATIDAEVTELRARWHLPADADLVELVHAEQERLFMEESGLGEALPRTQIRVSCPAAYIELLENVQIHGYHLMLAADSSLGRGQMAADWHAHVFVPAVEAIRTEGLQRRFPDATDADLFLSVYRRRRQLFPDCGCAPLSETARDLAAELRPRRPWSRRQKGLPVSG